MAKHANQRTSQSGIADNTAFTVPDTEKNPTPAESPQDTSATEPWDIESDPNHPTHRGILAVHKKRKGMHLRWVNENAIERRKMQGYKLAEPADYDVEGEDGKIRRNEMILMEIPQDQFEKNRAGVNARTEDLAKSAKADFRREANAAGRQTGGGVSPTEEGEEE